jgi:hypothetical protein
VADLGGDGVGVFGKPLAQHLVPVGRAEHVIFDADPAEADPTLGAIEVDDEDGDRSFSFDMKVPVGRETLQEYLRMLFENEKLKIVARARKMDSVELNSGDDFLGVISADDPKGKSYTLQMAILDYDLEDF